MQRSGMAIVNSLNFKAMITSKTRNNHLIGIAEQVLQNNDTGLLKDNKTKASNESYNGKIAAFGVSVAMSGLLPTLAIYYSEKDSRNVNLRNILDVLAKMIHKDRNGNCPIRDAHTLLKYAIDNRNNELLNKQFKKDLLDSSIALKQVFRTYMV